MSTRQTACPSCGAPITFQVSTSLVVICEYCNSLVARGDVNPEDLGKVAQLAASESPLSVGLEGAFHHVRFVITGGAQFQHPAGGTWDEWYASFADGRWGWIAEAQGGRFYLTFEQKGAPVPSYEELSTGQSLSIAGHEWVVAERNKATVAGMKGELPFRPGGDLLYADLSGPGGAFGTIDYSTQPPSVYVGRELTLADLGLEGKKVERAPRQVGAQGLKCPSCGGGLALRSPESQRVTCPHCSSLLDVNERRELQFLEKLHPRQLQIDVGARGNLRGDDWSVLGMLERSTHVDGERYTWEEYLLYNAARGSRWLVFSDDQWSFVRPVPPGDVQERHGEARFGGSMYTLEQSSQGRVEYVAGEFPWKVTRGETVHMADYERGQVRLSKEWTNDEVNWSQGEPVSASKIAEAFGRHCHIRRVVERPSLPVRTAPDDQGMSCGGILLTVFVIVVLLLCIISAILNSSSPSSSSSSSSYSSSSSSSSYSSGSSYSGSFRGSSGGSSYGSHGGK